MKNKTLLLFGFLLVSLSICAQSSFSYKRQLNYKQCEKCNCKKSRSYKIISTNLTATQLVCAQEDNRANLTVKEMFQNGTSGGLFGGFNPPQEGCGNDCYHEFVNASDEVETVKIDECLTESQRQKIRDEQERVKNEKIKLDEEERHIAKNERKRINELRDNAYLDYDNKKIQEACKKFREIIDFHIYHKSEESKKPGFGYGNFWNIQEVEDLNTFLSLLYMDNQFETMYTYCSSLLIYYVVNQNGPSTPFVKNPPSNPIGLPNSQLDDKTKKSLMLNYLISIILNKKELNNGWASNLSVDKENIAFDLIKCLKQKQTNENSAYINGVIQEIENRTEDSYPAYGVVFSKYFAQTSYSINDEIRKNMQKRTVRLAKSTKISENFYYFYGGSNLTFFYFILPAKSDYRYSNETVKWKGSIIILNSFNIKNNEPPSDKKIAKALNKKIELEKVIELEKGIILENKTHFFSGH
jgi:hypothetical protein